MLTPNKTKTIYICQACGHHSLRWVGKCPDCGTWNSMTEERVTKRKRTFAKQKMTPTPLGEVDVQDEDRVKTGLKEFDRVVGGGVIKGSVVLVGGDPGIGKSTLLLQISEKIASGYDKVLYITGEESLKQIRLRSERLKIIPDKIEILTETNLDLILEVLRQDIPFMVVIDSIQTTYTQNLESTPGSISQIRECAHKLINFAKETGSSVFLVGHVTKDGSIAGPKVLEHMVDTVLYFEGEKNHIYRILRTVKNRFGSTNEIGIFQMQEYGLEEVENPSLLFLSERAKDISGSVVVCSLEGTRPLLLELQALVSPSTYGMPQRVSSGIDYKRLSLLLAILEKRADVSVGAFDVFVNVAGGVKIEEPAVDLGTMVAIASSFKDIPADNRSVLLGEVGLGGEVRAVNQIERRIKEAEKLGFKNCIIPQGNLKALNQRFNIKISGVKSIKETFDLILI
ncbi:MAG: DNA repair protein RadA [candidate division Zixibacteria bacterium SM1_73]|nr:MAG: DNA repair protein RadA [candidate division Zixibacteria bacterium SM1_73]